MTAFQRKVARVVRRIPRGTTLSYGEVALRAGKPGGARAVVRALHALGDIPWWRVARRDGSLAPAIAYEQSQLLRQEGWRKPTANREGAKNAKGREKAKKKFFFSALAPSR